MKRNGKISISPQALIAFSVLALGGSARLFWASLVAAALHEAGHFLAARLLHIKITSFRLEAVGARLEIADGRISYLQELLLAAAGPFASLALSALCFPLWHCGELFKLLSYASFLLGTLNLLPVESFDGGRMLSCIFALFLPARAHYLILRLLSFFTAFLLWSLSVYFLLRAADGLAVLCFSTVLLLRFFHFAEGSEK